MAGGLERVGVILVADDVGGFMRTITGADRAIAGFADGAGAAGRRFSSGFAEVVTGALREVGASVTRFATSGLASIGGGFLDLVKGGLDFNNSIEQTTAKLNAFTKDGRKSAEILEMIKDRASKTPFEFEEMAEAAASLLPASKASGKGLEELIGIAEILAASNPAEGLEGAAFALKEAVSGDFMSVIERFNLPRQRLNELKEQGVPALEAVQIAMRELGFDTDLVTNLANTASGRWSTFKDTITALTSTITQPIFDVFSGGLAKVNDLIVANQPKIDAFAASLAGGVALAVERVSGAIQGVLRWLQGAAAAWGYWEKGIISTRTALDVLIPGLGDKLGPAIDVAIGFIGRMSGAIQNLAMVFQAGGLSGIVTVFEDGTSAFSSFLEKLGLSESAALSVNTALATVISSFQQGGVASQLLGTYIDTLKERWNVLLPAITTVVNGIWGVVSGVFGAVQTFMAAHGTEVLGFVTTTWNSINTIINDVLQIVAIVTGGKLAEVANYFTTYSAEIQTVATVAWNIVSGVITTALNLIQGTVRATLLLVQGDWQGAWTQIQIMSAHFVGTINNAIQSFLDLIAGAFGTSLQEIRELWSHNWNEMVKLVMRVPSLVAGVGSAIVDTISNGFSSAWNNFMASASAKLQEFRDMLPFSEPKDTSSPLYGLGKSGWALMSMIQDGMNAAPKLTVPAPDLGLLIPDTKEIATPLADAIADAPLSEKTLKMLEQLRHKMALLDPSDIQAINALATTIEQATAAGRQEALDLARVSPPATAAQMAAGSGTVNNTRNQTINMPIHTNMTPTAISQSMAIIAASMP